jgi:hypothetical protein
VYEPYAAALADLFYPHLTVFFRSKAPQHAQADARRGARSFL